jgi:hypothetical protein
MGIETIMKNFVYLFSGGLQKDTIIRDAEELGKNFSHHLPSQNEMEQDKMPCSTKIFIEILGH